MKPSNSKVTEVNDLKFNQEVLDAAELTVVDFWAEWCGPCRALSPTIESLSEEYSGRLKVVKLNVDENPETSSKFGIRGLPTVLLFKGGQIVDQIVGAAPKHIFKEAIERHL